MLIVEPRQQLIALLPQLRSFARFLVRQSGEADDLVQEAVLRALGALDQFNAETSLRAWMFTILRNVFYEQSRRRKIETYALQQNFAQEEARGPAQEAHLDIGDLQRQLFTLTPVLREALVLVGAQGLSYEEAAAICGVPTGTVKARVSRARKQLSDAIGPGTTSQLVIDRVGSTGPCDTSQS